MLPGTIRLAEISKKLRKWSLRASRELKERQSPGLFFTPPCCGVASKQKDGIRSLLNGYWSSPPDLTDSIAYCWLDIHFHYVLQSVERRFRDSPFRNPSSQADCEALKNSQTETERLCKIIRASYPYEHLGRPVATAADKRLFHQCTPFFPAGQMHWWGTAIFLFSHSSSGGILLSLHMRIQ